MNKYSLVNLVVALFITILVVLANGLNGDGKSITSVVFCTLVSAIIMTGFEVFMKITGILNTGNWKVYLTEAVICISVSLLALAI